jgi:hypothetical protein
VLTRLLTNQPTQSSSVDLKDVLEEALNGSNVRVLYFAEACDTTRLYVYHISDGMLVSCHLATSHSSRRFSDRATVVRF